MVFVVSFLVGLISGILYSEHIYKQSTNPHRKGFLMGFLLRFSLVAILGTIMGLRFGGTGLLAFLGGHTLGRIIHTLIRGFVIVRY